MSITWLVAAVLCLVVLSATAEEDEVMKACGEQCGDYIRWAYDCAQRARCFQMQENDQDAFVACYKHCNAGASKCQQLCQDNYDDLKDTCQQQCEDSSIMDISCESNCLDAEFESQYAAQLPDLTSQDVGVWQGIPGLDENADLFDNDDDEQVEDGGDD